MDFFRNLIINNNILNIGSSRNRSSFKTINQNPTISTDWPLKTHILQSLFFGR